MKLDHFCFITKEQKSWNESNEWRWWNSNSVSQSFGIKSRAKEDLLGRLHPQVKILVKAKAPQNKLFLLRIDIDPCRQTWVAFQSSWLLLGVIGNISRLLAWDKHKLVIQMPLRQWNPWQRTLTFYRHRCHTVMQASSARNFQVVFHSWVTLEPE